MRHISHPGLWGRGESGVVNCREWRFNVRNLSPCNVPSWQGMAGPSHLSQAASYITHSSCPPLHPWRRRGEWEEERGWCKWTALQSSSYSTIRNTSITGPKSNFEPTDTHTHVFTSCDIDELWTTAAKLPWTFKKAYRDPLWGTNPAHRPSLQRWVGRERGLQCCSALWAKTIQPLGGTSRQNQWEKTEGNVSGYNR